MEVIGGGGRFSGVVPAAGTPGGIVGGGTFNGGGTFGKAAARVVAIWGGGTFKLTGGAWGREVTLAGTGSGGGGMEYKRGLIMGAVAAAGVALVVGVDWGKVAEEGIFRFPLKWGLIRIFPGFAAVAVENKNPNITKSLCHR